MTIFESVTSASAWWRRTLGVVAPTLAFLGLLAASSCSQDETPIVLGKGGDGGVQPGFTPNADGGPRKDSGTSAMCPTSECPAGRTTCQGSQFPCDVDLLWDNLNCGSCGTSCNRYGDLRSESICNEGTCVLQCLSGWGEDNADCNGLVEDGCEIDLASNKKNCGVCGHACGDLEMCYEGQCVCAISESCGACGRLCPPPPGDPPHPPEWHIVYGCQGGQCNELICESPFEDCNKDFPLPTGDGCEIDTSSDPLNCGGCGKACALGEICDFGQCKCPCGARCFKGLNSDPRNCGSCFHDCAGAGQQPGTDPVCNQGVCEYPCITGYADCDHMGANGCEVNILDDPENCGGCGIRCSGIEGQACVEGRCTMKECGVQ